MKKMMVRVLEIEGEGYNQRFAKLGFTIDDEPQFVHRFVSRNARWPIRPTGLGAGLPADTQVGDQIEVEHVWAGYWQEAESAL